MSADGSAVPNAAGDTREVHVEELVGRRLCDVDGRKVGRIEEKRKVGVLALFGRVMNVHYADFAMLVASRGDMPKKPESN